MGIPPFKTIGQKDSRSEQFQQHVANLAKNIENKAILDGLLVESVSLIAGVQNLVAHTLARMPMGYLVVSRDANTAVWNLTSPIPDRFLDLRCGSNVTISLWVF